MSRHSLCDGILDMSMKAGDTIDTSSGMLSDDELMQLQLIVMLCICHAFELLGSFLSRKSEVCHRRQARNANASSVFGCLKQKFNV